MGKAWDGRNNGMLTHTHTHTHAHAHAHTLTHHTPHTVIRTIKSTSPLLPLSSPAFPPSTTRLHIASNWSSVASSPSTIPSLRHRHQAGRRLPSGTGGVMLFQPNHDQVSPPPVTRGFYIHPLIQVVETSFRKYHIWCLFRRTYSNCCMYTTGPYATIWLSCRYNLWTWTGRQNGYNYHTLYSGEFVYVMILYVYSI